MSNRNEFTAIAMFTFVLFCGALLFGISRHLAETYGMHAFQVMFFYCSIGFIGVIPLTLKNGGLAAIKTSRIKLYSARAVMEFLSFSITIYALTLITLPAHTALSFSTPIIASITAILILKERPTHHTWVALVLGVVGVLVVTQPWSGLVDPRALIMLVAGLGFSLCGVSIKFLTQTEPPIRVAFYMLGLTGVVALPFAASQWTPITMALVPWIIAIGVCALAQQVLVAKAIQRVPLTTILPLNFLTLIFTSIIAFFFFSELINGETLIGAVVILGATMYSAYGSSQAAATNNDGGDDSKPNEQQAA